MTIASLCDEWADKKTGEILHTFTIVTTKANPLLAKIHNNPKLKEARMPVILRQGAENEWLETSPEKAKKLIKPFVEKTLDAYTVRPLRGKASVGNKEKAL